MLMCGEMFSNPSHQLFKDFATFSFHWISVDLCVEVFIVIAHNNNWQEPKVCNDRS